MCNVESNRAAMADQKVNLNRRFESTPGFVMQSRRLSQILWVSTIAAFTSLVVFWFKGWDWTMAQQSLLGTFGVFLLCIWLIHRRHAYRATTLFILTLTVMSCALIYQAQGLHDEALLIFPGIMMLTSMFGTRRQFYLLLIGLIGFLVFVVAAHQTGWHRIPDRVETTFSALAYVLVILICSGFFAFVLASDLRKALIDLNGSKRELLELNEQLEDRVGQRTEQVEAANLALHESMEKLEQAMNELVHVEKLASLGSMVAGISHELNTPIGNSLLAATTMERMFDKIAVQIGSGSIKRSALEEFIQEGQEMSTLITRSTKRAADMVLSFKQVAVDQTSEQRRQFDLRAVIEDNLSAMVPQFKKSQIKVNNVVPEGIQCNSFPGPLGQILTNVVQNALLHGFEESAPGNLMITAEIRSKDVIVSVQDDGVGMPSHVMAHVFDPFFTTRLGRGGSGLGLSISHRIATSVLGGDLAVESVLGKGTIFFITLPKTAPFPI